MYASLVLAAATTRAGAQAVIAAGDGFEVSSLARRSPIDEDAPKAYSKKVGGLVWLEGVAGPSRFDVTQLRDLNWIPDAVAQRIPTLVVVGPEYGAALKFRTGSVTIGGRFKQADYDPFDLITAGLEFDFLIRAVPYVHPTIKLGLNYNKATGGLEIPGFEGLLTNLRADGGGASIGVGLRIPLVKWISIAAGFEYSVVALAIRGTEGIDQDPFSGGTAGTSIAGNFALTVHLGR